MTYKYLLIGLIFSAILISCGETNQRTSESTPELSTLEKEHLLEKASYADSVNAGLLEDTFKGSARRETIGYVRETAITINYGSPGKRGRVIWNGLVSYDQVWVSGSHWATAITFSKDVVIGETEVPAGMYGFFTIPGREEWTVILNKNFDQHLADEYDASDDIVRLTVQPEILETPVQRLTYSVEELSETSGTITLSWDMIKVKMPLEVK